MGRNFNMRLDVHLRLPHRGKALETKCPRCKKNIYQVEVLKLGLIRSLCQICGNVYGTGTVPDASFVLETSDEDVDQGKVGTFPCPHGPVGQGAGPGPPASPGRLARPVRGKLPHQAGYKCDQVLLSARLCHRRKVQAATPLLVLINVNNLKVPSDRGGGSVA
eukprot:g37011.t1